MHIPSHQAILTDSEYEIYISESIFSHIIFYTHLYEKRKTSDRLVQISIQWMLQFAWTQLP